MAQLTDLSFKWLQAFRATAQSGSMKTAAVRLGVVPSTVSYHITCLEQAIGAPLLHHHERPLRPTFEGAALLLAIDEGFGRLEQGVMQLSSRDRAQLSQTIRIASIEDFDADILPGLAQDLLHHLPRCRFTYQTRPSHRIRQMLAADEAHLGLAASDGLIDGGMIEIPILRDPFLIVAPAGDDTGAEALLSGQTEHLFLRYSADQLLRRRIEAELSRRQIRLEAVLEFESTASILGLIAERGAWTITTALNYARNPALHDRIRPLPFPSGRFARQISLFHTTGLPPDIARLTAGLIRPLIDTRILRPTLARAPWLEGEMLLEAAPKAGSETDP